jgi:hypothetical protein
VDVQKREDRLLDEISTLHRQRRLALTTLDLFDYAYPEMRGLVADVRKCYDSD